MEDTYLPEEYQSEEVDQEEMIPIVPHLYPKRILLFFGFFLLLFLYCLTTLPAQFSAMSLSKRGDALMAKGDFKEAAYCYKELADKSRSTADKLNLAIAYFRMKEPETIKAGLYLIQDLSLNKQQTSRLVSEMPTDTEIRQAQSDSISNNTIIVNPLPPRNQ
jgi:hypothetical protein